MSVQQSITFELADGQIGNTLDVLVDSAIGDESDAWIGRTISDAPEVDSVVFLTADGIETGQIVPCEIVARKDYDLIGVVSR